MMRGCGFGYGNMMGGSWLGEIVMLLFGLLVLTGIVLLIIWAIRSVSGQQHAAGPQQPGAPPPGQAAGPEEAVAIARRRLASGEITPEQYAEIMRTLGAG